MTVPQPQSAYVANGINRRAIHRPLIVRIPCGVRIAQARAAAASASANATNSRRDVEEDASSMINGGDVASLCREQGGRSCVWKKGCLLGRCNQPEPHATISIGTSSVLEVVWKDVDASGDDDNGMEAPQRDDDKHKRNVHQTEQGFVKKDHCDKSDCRCHLSVTDQVVVEKDEKPKTARVSTGGHVARPTIRRRDRRRLAKLKKKLRRRIRKSFKAVVGNGEHSDDVGGVDDGKKKRVRCCAGDDISENRPTNSMFPEGNSEYASAPRNGSRKIYRTLTDSLPRRVVRRYEDMLRLLACTVVKEGMVGGGLFVDGDVRRNGLICEYTGHRIRGRQLRLLHAALDYHKADPNVLVAIPSEDAEVDPRVVGTEGQFVNHSCAPNARLVELDCRGKTLVFIAALRPLKCGEEVFIDYEWYSNEPGSLSPVECFCGIVDCRGYI